MLSFLSLLLLPLAGVPAIAAGPSTDHTLSRRYTDIRFSNYNAGDDEGACGGWNTDDQYVVALSKLNFNGGQYCGKQIYITYKGLSAVAKIVDECEGCPDWGLDFSQSLFGHFVGGEQNNEEVGWIWGDWVFGTGPSNDDGDTTTTTTKHTTSTTSTTHTTTSTTSTHKTSSTSTTHSSSTTTSIASTTSSASKTSGTSASASTATAAETGTNNLYAFSDAVANLVGLVEQAQAAL